MQPGNFLKPTKPVVIECSKQQRKYLNSKFDAGLCRRSDVETKNALAVKTVKAAGVSRINDLYSVVTAKCGKAYKNCTSHPSPEPIP
jgi:hypothetical protein